jgi:hypothetical protein
VTWIFDGNSIEARTVVEWRNMEFTTKGPLMVITTVNKMSFRWRYSMSLRDGARTYKKGFCLLFGLLLGHEHDFLQMYYG